MGERKEKEQKSYRQIENIADGRLKLKPNHIKIILNVKGLNTQLKKQKLSDCIEKEESIICCLQETH